MVKDLDVGLLDFPARLNNEDVYCAGAWARIASGSIIVRTRASPAASRSTRATRAINLPFNSPGNSDHPEQHQFDARPSRKNLTKLQGNFVTDHTENRLKNSASPYLRSAAHQPVDWHEWGEEAFAQARARRQAHPARYRRGLVPLVPRDGPRELRKSRKSPRIINELFIPVKVDRDERPDVDARYQAAVSAISGQGGWPLTAFLTPDGKPFFGGTYFPPDDSMGRPGFKRILLAIAEASKRAASKWIETAG